MDKQSGLTTRQAAEEQALERHWQKLRQAARAIMTASDGNPVQNEPPPPVMAPGLLLDTGPLTVDRLAPRWRQECDTLCCLYREQCGWTVEEAEARALEMTLVMYLSEGTE